MGIENERKENKRKENEKKENEEKSMFSLLLFGYRENEKKEKFISYKIIYISLINISISFK